MIEHRPHIPWVRAHKSHPLLGVVTRPKLTSENLCVLAVKSRNVKSSRLGAALGEGREKQCHGAWSGSIRRPTLRGELQKRHVEQQPEAASPLQDGSAPGAQPWMGWDFPAALCCFVPR